MQWNRSQTKLMQYASRRFEGCRVEVLKISDWGAGLTAALRHIERCSAAGGGNRSLVLDGVSQWDTVRSLAKKAALPGNGRGYFDTIHDAIQTASENRKRPVILWLEEARVMRPAERETIFAHFSYVSEHCDFDLRVVFVIGKVMVWVNAKQARVAGFPALGSRLVHKAAVMQFGRNDFSEVTESELVGAGLAREPGAHGVKAVAS